MKTLPLLATLLLTPLAALCAAEPRTRAAMNHVPLAWPELSRPETKPWTWWWWHGSAVTKADITANLEALQRSGIGGVNIVCLLDVRDEHAVKLRYLSKEWVEAVAHAVHEAHRLGMDADMSPVPGWAFGGPWVTREDACSEVEVTRLPLEECQKKGMRIAGFAKGTPGTPERRDLSAVMAQSADGIMVDVTAQVDEDGILRWTPPPGTWTFYTAMARVGSSRVRMPTYDGDGWVVDHLSSKSVKRYFESFDKAFALVDSRDLPRAFNNDSWEIHLNWTPGFLAEFAKRRGYDLRQQLPAFAGQGSPDLVSRVACDYRQTVSDLMLDAFTKTFREWAYGHGRRIIGEVIFEPGNELDINALYDIPQVDMGGPPSWHFPNGDYSTYHLFRRGKTAASPAHILGKPLIASETLTVMGPILDTPLELAKEKIDYDLVAGINHTMLHGIAYSPASARWPGWLFYAGTHLGPFNPMWRQGRAFCDYVARCQSFLQAGRPDADALIYFPIFDLWSQRQPGSVSPPGTIPPTDTEDYPGP
ncbi:MAG: glycosyl hydrolase, partial [Verrucomicrobia bacterium]|nr:glycosyl hydrolase [Verrucomicrobiota bacterium]